MSQVCRSKISKKVFYLKQNSPSKYMISDHFLTINCVYKINNDTIQGTSQEVGDFIGGELVLGTWWINARG